MTPTNESYSSQCKDAISAVFELMPPANILPGLWSEDEREVGTRYGQVLLHFKSDGSPYFYVM